MKLKISLKARLKRIRTKFMQQGDDTLSNQDFWFLNDQAEQASEIENRSLRNSLKECDEENKRLREALEQPK